MNIPEEIVEALVEHYGADAVRSALDSMQARYAQEKPTERDVVAKKRVPCPKCLGTGRVPVISIHGRAKCRHCNGTGEILRDVEDIEREEAWEAMQQEKDVAGIKDSGERSVFGSGAVRDMSAGKGRCDLLPMCALLRLARHYEAGALKYEERNWEKGIPAHSFADSALRHMFKYMDGHKDEDHLIAAVWNLCGLAWTEEKRPDLMDIPARLEA